MGYGRPVASQTRYETLGLTTGQGTTVTASGTPHAKGSYATIGTAGFTYDGFYVSLNPVITGTAERWRVDIAVNTGGSDQIIAEDVYCESATIPASNEIWVPVVVPSGATIKARGQTLTASHTIAVLIVGYQGDANQSLGFRALKACTDYSNEDATNAITLTGNTPTAWVQVMASSPNRVAALLPSYSQKDVAGTSGRVYVEVGWGASSSEATLFSFCISKAATVAQDVAGNRTMGVFPCDFPAATRFVARATASNAADTDVIQILLHGLAP